MRTDRETKNAVRSWLEDGTTQLPDRVLDEVLDRLPGIRQRRPWWRNVGLLRMNHSLPMALAAAAGVLAVLGVSAVAPVLNSGGAIPRPSQTASLRLLSNYSGSLQPGGYVIDDPFPVRVTFEVPHGWAACSEGPVELGVCRGELRGLAFLIVDNVVAEPCDSSRAQLDPPVGPSVDDLVAAISALPDFEATDPTSIRVDGFRGQELEVRAPPSRCNLATWSTVDRINGVAPGEVNLVRILDVDGVRLVITAAHQPGRTSEQELAELRQILDSVRIEP